jgi:catechol 2,3-dioxygenase-like lactoylglutathione lyase family enzyme
MRLRGLQHVSSPFRDGEQDLIRRFYGDVLGLTEIVPPKSLAHLKLVWFSAGPGLELHFFSGSPDLASTRHFCLNIDDLDETRASLESAGAQPFDDTPIPNRPRFFCRDPVGNLVEFTSIQGDYS